MKRWNTLALLLASGSLAACGSESTPPATDAGMSTDMGSPTDTGTPGDTGTATDAPRTDTGTPDAGGLRCGSLSVENLNTVGTRMGNVTRVMGDSTAAYMAQTMGNPPTGRTPVQPPSNNATCIRMSGQVAYAYTIGAMPASLRISTTNPGTPRNFDTVVWVTTRCTTSLSSAACNDDDPAFAASSDRRVSSTVTTEVLPAGTQVFILVGGFYPPGTGTIDRGMFELSVSEDVPVAMGGACRVDGSAQRCTTGLDCVGADPGAEMGTCRAQGSVAGSRCRTGASACDMGLTCATSGFCVTTSTVGMPCNAFAQCPAGSSCLINVLGAIEGVCRTQGSVNGSPCRPAGAMNGRCDMGLTCSGDLDPTDQNPTCRPLAAVGESCGIGAGGSLCPAGSTCVTVVGGAVGTCRANGTVANTACRAAGMTPRCDGMLTCRRAGDGQPELCVTLGTSGGVCDSTTVCPDNNTCYLTDLSDRQRGRCGAEGTAGGACSAGATRCTAPAVCSATDSTEDGLCQTVATAGMPCERPTSRCDTGLTCVLNMGSQSTGTCRAAGTVAGAACRATEPACDMGLTCAGTFLSGGVCQTTVAMGAACDPLNGTTRCPGEQVCIPRTFSTGTCGAATGMEMEPNNSPAAVAMRAITAPSAFRGALPFGDVDCVAVTVPANGRIVAQVSDGNGRCPAPFQGAIALDLYDTNGTTVRGVVTRTGPFGLGSCATIDGGRSTVHAFAGGLAAGTYTVCARPVRDTTTTTGPVPNYVLTVAPYGAM
jgi:hypothetical protein